MLSNENEFEGGNAFSPSLQDLTERKQSQRRQLYREMATALAGLDRQYESEFLQLQAQLQGNLRLLSEKAPGNAGEPDFNSESYQGLLVEQGRLEEDFLQQSESLKARYEQRREEIRSGCRAKCIQLDSVSARSLQ